MSGSDFSVVAVPLNRYNESATTSCREIGTVKVPGLWPRWSQFENGVFLKWDLEECKRCEEIGRGCGYQEEESPFWGIGCGDRTRNGMWFVIDLVMVVYYRYV